MLGSTYLARKASGGRRSCRHYSKQITAVLFLQSCPLLDDPDPHSFMTALSRSIPAKPVADADVTVALAAVLRDGTDAADALAPFKTDVVMAAAAQHGVAPLLRRALVAGGSQPAWAGDLVARLDRTVGDEKRQGVWRRQQTIRVIDGLHRAGVATLILQGDALAHTHYPAPYLRPRCDTDVLVRQGDVRRVQAVLASLGYRRLPIADGEPVHTQCAFEHVQGFDVHVIDLHWAVSCRPLFAAMAAFDELARDARPVDALGEHARTPSPVWSLLLACIHRVAHHNDADCLIWLYDVKLLADRLTLEEWSFFWALASHRAVVEVCRSSLSLAHERLGLGPDAARSLARVVAVPRRYEPASEFLGGQISTLRMIALDAKAVRGVGKKVKLVASHVFPDQQYMREVFHVRTRLGLIAAYARRATAGAWRLIH